MLMKNFSPEISHCGKVRLTYETMDDYYSVFKPLLFLECWAQVIIGNSAITMDINVALSFTANSIKLVFPKA